MQDLVRAMLPGGTHMCSHASLNHILKEREKIANDLGISSRANEASTYFDVIKSKVRRLEYLGIHRLLTPCIGAPSCLIVQLLADASQIFRGKNTNATTMVLKPIYDDNDLIKESVDLVNIRFNLVLVALYRKDDSHDNLCSHAASVILRVVPLLYRQTFQANVSDKVIETVAQ